MRRRTRLGSTLEQAGQHLMRGAEPFPLVRPSWCPHVCHPEVAARHLQWGQRITRALCGSRNTATVTHRQRQQLVSALASSAHGDIWQQEILCREATQV